MNQIAIVKSYIVKAWPIYLISLVLHVIANGINVYYPRVLGEFTDTLQIGGLTKNLVVTYSLMLLGIGIAYVVFNGIAMYLVMYLGRKFEFRVRTKLFRHFTNMSERFYNKNGVGKLLSFFMNDVTAIREALSNGFNASASAIMLLVAAIFMMIISGIPLYLIAACIGPLLLIPIIVVYLGPKIRTRSLKVQEALGGMTDMAEEQFGGVRVTKKFAAEEVMEARFGATVDAIRSSQLKLVRVSSLFQAIIPYLGTIALIIALAFGGYLASTGHITLGNFVALTLYIRMLMNPLQQIGNVINAVQRSRASLQRLNGLLSQPADITESEQAIAPDLSCATLRIRNLSFTYPTSSEASLKHLSLELKPGETLGIIGKTGSGKTTLMKLLLRMYDPPAGTIMFDHVDIRELTLESLRNQVAYVPQEGFLFSTTIRDNIAFHNRSADLGSVETAAKQARIYDHILAMPERFDTSLGERGLTLSGGQRQRTSLARGLIKDAPIMILDDSVSAVDAVTEKQIIASIQTERQHRTTIIVSHRISAMKHADQIIVLDEGAIVQRGTHEELLQETGLYAELYAIQEEGSQYGSSHS